MTTEQQTSKLLKQQLEVIYKVAILNLTLYVQKIISRKHKQNVSIFDEELPTRNSLMKTDIESCYKLQAEDK